MHTIIPIIFLMFTYLALSNNLQVANIILGFFIAAGILLLLRPPKRPVKWRRLPAALMSAFVYIVVLLYNMFRSGIQVARIILHPKLPIKSGIVGIRAAGKSELGRALSAHAISLPPGELLVEMDEDGTMYIHSLDVDLTVKQAGAAQKYQGDMLKKIFD
ncbi:MAG: Na+/H+ antiporter subunit E [bacterium]|nr:Na+/H+ antiporter subunit E [bacterium]